MGREIFDREIGSHEVERELARDMPNARAQKKQNEILSAASELFLKCGYDAVSLDDIVEQVGGSKTTLYSYYGGKEGLFAACIEELCHEKLSRFLATDVADCEPREGLTALGQQFLSVLSGPKDRNLFRAMIAEAQRFPELAAKFFEAGPETAIRVVRRNIERWQQQGLLRAGNSETLAIQFLGLMMGNFHLKRLLGLTDSLTDRQICTWVARGVELFLEGALPPRD